MTIRFTRNEILCAIGALWFLYLELVYTGFNQFQLLNVVGFFSLALVPGFLCIKALRFSVRSAWGSVALSCALSLLVLMVAAYVANVALPLLHIAKPLSKFFLLGTISLVVACLAVASWLRFEDTSVTFALSHSQLLRNIVYVLIPVLFTGMGIVGALALNNGGSGLITLCMLFAMALYAVFLVRSCDALGNGVVPTAIFFMALALLLMTSLRGSYITGHDIQREFKVFELAKTAGVWSMSAYPDAYNACLSITILPTVFANLLAVPDVYIYKLLYPIFFALTPVLIYLTARYWLGRNMAFICAFFTMTFPTFFEDMPFLARQEIAFLFFGSMLYVLFGDWYPEKLRIWLFGLLGVGMVLSHYSTTYTVLIVFALALLLRVLFQKILQRYLARVVVYRARITLGMFLLLLAATVVWTSVLTNSGGNIVQVAVKAATDGFTESSRSVDAASLISFNKPNPAYELMQYAEGINAARYLSPQEYFATSTYSAYVLQPITDPVLALTPAGIFLQRMGLVPSIFLVGGILAKLFELLIPIGMVYALVRPFIFRHLESELYLLAVASLVFVSVNAIVPVLSTEYGVFRAIQQSLFVLVPFVILGAAVVGSWLGRVVPYLRNRPQTVPLALCVAFFLYSTAAIPQVLGGTDPVLHLTNTGFYYDKYLTHASEVYGIQWLAAAYKANPNADVEADRFAQNKIVSLAPIGFAGDIFPAGIKKDAFVFLDWENTQKQKSSVLYKGSLVTYRYPAAFLDSVKNLVYDNGEVRIYK